MTDSSTPPRPSISDRAFRIALVVVLALALAVRVGAVERYSEIELQTDALDYDRHAVSIAEGNGFPEALRVVGGPGPSAWRPPLYPYFLGGVYVISGTTDEAKRLRYGRISQAALGVGAVALIALIAVQLWGRREAVAAAAIAAVFPPLIFAGTTLLTEPLFIALMLGGVAAMLHYRQGDDRIRWLVLAGALAGLATLTRANGIVLVAIFALAAWTVRPWLSRRALARPAIVAAAALAAIAPWTVRNAIELDAFVPITTQTGFAVVGTYNDVAADEKARWVAPFEVPELAPVFETATSELEVDEQLMSHATDYMRENPTYIAEVAFWNTLRYFNLHDPVEFERLIAMHAGQPQGLAELSVYSFWLLLPIAVAGCFTSAARRIPPFIWLTMLLLILSVVFVFGMTRYRHLIDPFLILLAATSLTWAWSRMEPLLRPGEARDSA